MFQEVRLIGCSPVKVDRTIEISTGEPAVGAASRLTGSLSPVRPLAAIDGAPGPQTGLLSDRRAHLRRASSIAIETGDAEHAYGVVVPDLPARFSAGDTLDEALANSREAILLHVEGLLDDGQPFPRPSTIEQLCGKRSYRGRTWAIVDVSELGDKTAIHGR